MLNNALLTIVLLLTSSVAVAGTGVGILHAGVIGLQLVFIHFVIKLLRVVKKEYTSSLSEK